jgi:hypothetical protein
MTPAADLCGRVDRMDNVEQAILRIERKIDLLVGAMTPAKVTKR